MREHRLIAVVAASLVDTVPAAAHIAEDTDTAVHPLDMWEVAVVAGILADMADTAAVVVVGSTVVVVAVDLPLMMRVRRCPYPPKLLQSVG